MYNNILIKLSNELDHFLVAKLIEIADEKHEFILTKQLLKSSTSIGANVREATMSQSRKDFISKISIARKECAESFAWTKNLKLAKLLSEDEVIYIDGILTQIHKILNKSISTSKKRLNLKDRY